MWLLRSPVTKPADAYLTVFENTILITVYPHSENQLLG